MSTTTTVKLYLAPANHYNAYCIAGYNEKTQCEQLARLVQERLSAYDGTAVYHTTVYADSCDYKGRPEEAAALDSVEMARRLVDIHADRKDIARLVAGMTPAKLCEVLRHMNVVEMMMAGAPAVQVGAANLVDPYACKKIIEDLPTVCADLGIDKLSDVIGVVKNG